MIMSPIEVGKLVGRIADNIENVIIGKRASVEQIVISLICQGHVLIEDVPGVGKTSLVSAMSKSISCSYRRIQFTPDVLPSDITGFSVYNMKSDEFEYKPGAVMSQIVLADEINRTPPKTQSALLEAMEEKQVTVDGATYYLPLPFMVLATQNPIEYLGTYPLPEAQLDRFFMRVTLGYPEADDECVILAKYAVDQPLNELRAVTDGEEILDAALSVRNVYVEPSIVRYIVEIIRGTRNNEKTVLGVSPRGALALQLAAQAWACCMGRDYCIPDDIKEMAVPVLSHRIKLKQEEKLKNIKPERVISQVLSDTAVPVPKNIMNKKRTHDQE
ncbi:MAG: AAA family ATPase [Oscillospiraceae bacterium]|nr:AAA family ATPase [Oscillospiraceae bacterium]